jgi:hypothetical protein
MFTLWKLFQDCFRYGYKLETKFSKGYYSKYCNSAESFRRCNHSYSKTFLKCWPTTIQWTKSSKVAGHKNILVTRRNNHILQTNILENHSHNSSSWRIKDCLIKIGSCLAIIRYWCIVFLYAQANSDHWCGLCLNWWFNNQSNCFNFC